MSRKPRARKSFTFAEQLEQRIAPAVFTLAASAGDAALRSAISTADTNADASNTINLGTGDFFLSNKALGSLVIQNQNPSVPNKTLTIIGQGTANTVIVPAIGSNWSDRVLHIEGSTTIVTLERLAIEGGHLVAAPSAPPTTANGGGILIDGGQVTLSSVLVSGNLAQGSNGVNGANGGAGGNGAGAQIGGDANGGGLYLAAGSLTVKNSTFSNNSVIGGQGGNGGAGGAATDNGDDGTAGHDGANGTPTHLSGTYVSSQLHLKGTNGQPGTAGGAATAGGNGGNGGYGADGGGANGGGLYVASGSVVLNGVTLSGNSAKAGSGGKGGNGGAGANGGAGGQGGIGGKGGWGGGPAGLPGNGAAGGDAGSGGDGGDGGAGGKGGGAAGGAVYQGGGTIYVVSSTVSNNSAVGAAAGSGGGGGAPGNVGQAGDGGYGGAAGAGCWFAGGGKSGNGGDGGGGGAGGDAGSGGAGGDGGDGGDATGGGFFVGAGTLTISGSTLKSNSVTGGNGAAGGAAKDGAAAGIGGYAGFAMNGAEAGTASTQNSSGSGGLAGNGGKGGSGGKGGKGGNGGDGGKGGRGGNAIGGGICLSVGSLILAGGSIVSSSATGGAGGPGAPGGNGGKGGDGRSGLDGGTGGIGFGQLNGGITGGKGGDGGNGGDAGDGGDGGAGGTGGTGGSASGGALFVAGGQIAKVGTVTYTSNTVLGGAAAAGGAGGGQGEAGTKGTAGTGGTGGESVQGSGPGANGKNGNPGVAGFVGMDGAQGIQGATGVASGASTSGTTSGYAATAPVITSSATAQMTTGFPGTFTVTATGAPLPLFGETGTLPTGVTFSSAGVLTSTATTPLGTYHFTISASNGIGTSTQAFTLTVKSPNHAPVGTTGTATGVVNTAYTVKTTDFGFTDPNDTPPDSFLAVKFTLLPGAGSLKDNGVALTVNQLVSVADITAGKLIFTPTATEKGLNFLCKFQVEDNGGTVGGGVNLDPTAKVLYVNLTPLNHAPVGTSGTVTGIINTPYTIKTANFGFTDPNDSPPNSLLGVKFTLLPGAGTLKDNGVAVTLNQLISAADISAGKLIFTPTATAAGVNFLCKFQVEDNGGTASGGVNLDPTAKVLYVNLLHVNHAPVGTTGTVTGRVNTPYIIKATDFGFTDPGDTPPNSLLGVKFTLLSSAGSLKDNGVAVTVNQLVTVADINAGKLVFTPSSNLSGGPFFLCKFQVEDNGGTANGGINLDPTAKILNIKLTT